ncbi:ABC transporter substrate-binding protein [Thaumasiovibrio sp. DFM-14]|uniref:ABC transporter substrate-binding protein n=1 Tax=Thaumasiovibrio sp. DFM-14 TaxID=3384792 RepID=UPI00399FAE1F
MRRFLLSLYCVTLLFCTPATLATDWTHIEQKAQGQTVYFYAWGGNPQVNHYIEWVASQVERQFDITLVHVKVADISDALTLIINDKSSDRDHGGKVDMLWLNGENFATLKSLNLLYGPFTDTLPNTQLLNPALPTDSDFSIPVEGLESPWGVGQLGFLFDEKTTPTPARSAVELLQYAKQHPGRISYPQPPQFHGTTFLKQLLWELTDDPDALRKDVSEVDFDAVTQPLWTYLDELHHYAWYKGRRFPQSDRHMIQLMGDRELHMAITFNPGEGPAAVQRGDIPSTVSQHTFRAGALTNIHFLAIPYNSDVKEGAKVVIDYLMSAEAQTRKADIAHWGDPTVLAPEHVPSVTAELSLGIPEPHFTWHTHLPLAWKARYGF